jgi:probable rRNA maturation factor
VRAIPFDLACEVAWDADALGDLDPVEAMLDERHVQTIVAVALHEAGADAGMQIEVGVTFCGPQRIAQLNAEHRQIDEPTDVLAFPIDGLTDPVPEGMPRQLGDVVICPTYVAKQVVDGATMLPKGPGQEEGDDTLTAALERCVAHGVLHLAGFDHELSDAAATEMFSLEQIVVDRVRGV